MNKLKVIDGDSFDQFEQSPPVDDQTLQAAAEIVNDVSSNGRKAIVRYGTQFGELSSESESLFIDQTELAEAYNRIDKEDQDLLTRVAQRIGRFAKAQLDSLGSLSIDVPGGKAGHSIEPIRRVGCYAPGGRYPLPSTVLMTTVTARVAGCQEIVLASPKPTDIVLAAAYVGGATEVLRVGGAHTIAAMAYGFEGFDRCDLIAGPGNKWVTAAKQLVVGSAGIDMLAGPSELVVVADDDNCPVTVAADILGQAEHDVDARPFLICLSRSFANQVNIELGRQLETLETAETASQALLNGGIIVCADKLEAVRVCNQLAPEHLELHLSDADSFANEIKNAGCIFIGSKSAEVFGDYGAGPNHTLPTGGTSRWSAGLNVFTFVRIRTWLKLQEPTTELINDTARLATHEGLIGHRNSANQRLK